MTRNFKALGLALVAVLAMSVVAASAQANDTTRLTVEEAHTILEGTQVGKHALQFGSREATCEIVEFDATTTASGLTEVTTFEPSYEECHTKPILGISFTITVTMNGCHFLLTGKPTETVTTGGVTHHTYNAKVDIVCPPGVVIERHVYNNGIHPPNHNAGNTLCTLTIGSQETGGSNTITNIAGNPDHIEIHHDMVLSTVSHGSSICRPFGVSDTQAFNSTYIGTTTFKAFNTAGEQKKLTVSHETETHEETTEEHAETHQTQTESSELTPEDEEAGQHATLKGEQTTTHEWALGSRTLTCTTATFEGTVAGNTTTATISPTYSGCHTKPVLGVSFTATVTMNGCDFLFHGAPTEEEETASKTIHSYYTATIDIVCPEGKAIEVDIYKFGASHKAENHLCTVTIKPQNGLKQSRITNMEGGESDDLTVHSDLIVKATNHGSGLCGSTETAKESETRYTGTSTIRAYDTEEKQIDLTVGHGPGSEDAEIRPGEGGVSEGGQHATLKGEQTTTHELEFGSRTLTCEKATFSGTIEGDTKAATITPSYEGCHTKPVLGVSLTATATMNGCDLLFEGAPTEEEETVDKTIHSHYTATMDVVCPEGKAIEIDVYKFGTSHKAENYLCTLTIKPQTGLEQSRVENMEGSGSESDDLTIHSDLTIKASRHGSELCGGGGEFNVRYTGTSTVRAYDTEEEQIDLTVSHEDE